MDYGQDRVVIANVIEEVMAKSEIAAINEEVYLDFEAPSQELRIQ